MPVILGGGIAGLSAAYYLKKHFVNPISLFEMSNRLGGWIRTENHVEQNFLFETGPRTIRARGPAAMNTLQLIEDLELGTEISPVCSTHPAARNRMIYAKGELLTLPSTLSSIFIPQPPFSKSFLSALLHDIITAGRKQTLEDESIHSFVARRFGEEFADYAISPLICGICAGNAKNISVRFLLNDFFEMEQKHGSVTKGLFLSKKWLVKDAPQFNGNIHKRAKTEKWSIFSMKGGMETLPKSLADRLQNLIHIELNAKCKRISFSDEGGAELTIDDSTIKTDHIISSIPAFQLAETLEHDHPSLAGQLRTIPYVDVAVINIQFNTADVIPYNAFGFLVPPIEKLPLLGVVFDSCCSAMRGNTVLTCMMGGYWFEEIFGKFPTQTQIFNMAMSYIQSILHINKSPMTKRVHILRKCIPQYTVGHKKRVEEIRKYIQTNKLPLTLCGAAYDGVGVNDVILTAKKQIDQLVGFKTQ